MDEFDITCSIDITCSFPNFNFFLLLIVFKKACWSSYDWRIQVQSIFSSMVMRLFKWGLSVPAGIYLRKVNNRNTRTMCKSCSKLTIKTTERCHWLSIWAVCGVTKTSFKQALPTKLNKKGRVLWNFCGRTQLINSFQSKIKKKKEIKKLKYVTKSQSLITKFMIIIIKGPQRY